MPNQPQSHSGQKSGDASKRSATTKPSTKSAKASQGSKGNFKNDPERAAEAGRKGGKS
ncbi:KGG domain-containing protein [Ensifer adhaerens]|uniref:KGG domain-containing protein n=1 Tax=Ensifer adhaerens TaxID=106592 RepID=UPI000A4B4598|nr:KGG domain-containing protein [Ensifer adhaerens]